MSKLVKTAPELHHGATRNNIIMILTPTNWPQPVGPRHQHQPPPADSKKCPNDTAQDPGTDNYRDTPVKLDTRARCCRC